MNTLLRNFLCFRLKISSKSLYSLSELIYSCLFLLENEEQVFNELFPMITNLKGGSYVFKNECNI